MCVCVRLRVRQRQKDIYAPKINSNHCYLSKSPEWARFWIPQSPSHLTSHPCHSHLLPLWPAPFWYNLSRTKQFQEVCVTIVTLNPQISLAITVKGVYELAPVTLKEKWFWTFTMKIFYKICNGNKECHTQVTRQTKDRTHAVNSKGRTQAVSERPCASDKNNKGHVQVANKTLIMATVKWYRYSHLTVIASTRSQGRRGPISPTSPPPPSPPYVARPHLPPSLLPLAAPISAYTATTPPSA